jgi:hypothetical protein
MGFSENDRILIKLLRLEKRYSSGKFLKEFPDKNWYETFLIWKNASLRSGSSSIRPSWIELWSSGALDWELACVQVVDTLRINCKPLRQTQPFKRLFSEPPTCFEKNRIAWVFLLFNNKKLHSKIHMHYMIFPYKTSLETCNFGCTFLNLHNFVNLWDIISKFGTNVYNWS